VERTVSGPDGGAQRPVGQGLWRVEFWFAAIKVTTVLVFIAVGLLMIFGILQGGAPEGLWGNIANFSAGDAPFAGGFAALIGVAMVVGFSFQGTELIGIAAGESEDRPRTCPAPCARCSGAFCCSTSSPS
jgi:lysine-specific permease